MKKIILILVICFLCIGCSKKEKNITINIYEDSDKSELKEEAIVENVDKEVQVIENTQEQINYSIDTDKKDIKEEKIIDYDIQKTSEETSFNKITNKVKDTYNSAKDWYNENKEELKDINNEIVESDKNTINGWINKTTTWYKENKDEIKTSAQEIYNSDKEAITNLYDKIKN